jgi:hypothetical protein
LNVPDTFPSWISSLERRHLGDLTFAEVSRALRALSSTYVERRHKLSEGAALSGAGKRAAFALFYGPLHFLLVHYIASKVSDTSDPIGDGGDPAKVSDVSDSFLVDLGCGTGASGAGWATACPRPPRIVGIDRHPWVVSEASRTYREFGLDGRARQDDVATAKLPNGRASILAAFTLNELSEPSRALSIARHGAIACWSWSRWPDSSRRGGTDGARHLSAPEVVPTSGGFEPSFRPSSRNSIARPVSTIAKSPGALCG